VDTDTLSSLPIREFQSGLYEVVKYGLICDSEFFEYIENSLTEIQGRDVSSLERVISRCCEIKAGVTARDEIEQDLRRILNFGHTVGHALEVATGYDLLTHGEAIGWGMIAETYLSQIKGWIDEATCERVVHCIKSLGPLPRIDSVSREEILQAMQRDKKRQDGQLVLVALQAVGQTLIAKDVEKPLLLEAWEKTVRLSS